MSARSRGSWIDGGPRRFAVAIEDAARQYIINVLYDIVATAYYYFIRPKKATRCAGCRRCSGRDVAGADAMLIEPRIAALGRAPRDDELEPLSRTAWAARRERAALDVLAGQDDSNADLARDAGGILQDRCAAAAGHRRAATGARCVRQGRSVARTRTAARGA